MCVSLQQTEGCLTDELSVLSVQDGSVVTPATRVFYLCQQYSLVFVVDMSPSMTAVVRVCSHACVFCIRLTPAYYNIYQAPCNLGSCSLQSNVTFKVKVTEAANSLCSCLTLLARPVRSVLRATISGRLIINLVSFASAVPGAG